MNIVSFDLQGFNLPSPNEFHTEDVFTLPRGDVIAACVDTPELVLIIHLTMNPRSLVSGASPFGCGFTAIITGAS